MKPTKPRLKPTTVKQARKLLAVRGTGEERIEALTAVVRFLLHELQRSHQAPPSAPEINLGQGL